MASILIVDDESTIRIGVETILKKEDYTTYTAIDGDDCLKKLAKKKIDLILMDIMMPGTPIKEIIKKIKYIKIAYLSVVRKSEAEKEGLLDQKNIVGYFQKPFETDDLLKGIKEILRNPTH